MEDRKYGTNTLESKHGDVVIKSNSKDVIIASEKDMLLTTKKGGILINNKSGPISISGSSIVLNRLQIKQTNDTLCIHSKKKRLNIVAEDVFVNNFDMSLLQEMQRRISTLEEKDTKKQEKIIHLQKQLKICQTQLKQVTLFVTQKKD